MCYFVKSFYLCFLLSSYSLVCGSIYVTLYFYFSRNNAVALQCFGKCHDIGGHLVHENDTVFHFAQTHKSCFWQLVKTG